MNSRTRLTLLMVLSAASLAACTSGGSSSLTLTGLPYYIDGKSLMIDTRYIDLYACASGRPLMCTRTSRFFGDAFCHCP